MLGKVFGVVSVAAAMAVATPALAAVQFLSFSGTLNNQSKNGSSGPFGAGNGSLQGQSFSVVLSYDLAAFAGTSNCGSSPNTSCTFTLNNARTITETVSVNGGPLQTYLLNAGSFNLNASGNDNFSFGITGNGITSLQGNFTAANASANGFFNDQFNVSNAAFNTLAGFAVMNASFNQTTTNQTTTGYNIQATGGSITSLNANNGAVPEPAT